LWRVDVWCSLYMNGWSTVGAVLAATSRHEPRDGKLKGRCLLGWLQAERRVMSDVCGDMAPNLHDAVWTGDVAEVRRLVAAGADVEEQLGQLGLRMTLHAADIAARTVQRVTTLQVSIHQVAQVLRELYRELESTARAQQVAAKERAQQAAEQVIAKKREAADRVAAEILEEEEREEAAKTKVRLAPPSPNIGLHGVCSWVVSDAAFLSHG
jgi:hypothetical protein